MLSDATGLRAYDGVVPAARTPSEHRSDYRACKDAVRRANTVETRQLTALRRIITAPSPAVAHRERHRLHRGGRRPQHRLVSPTHTQSWLDPDRRDSNRTAWSGGSPARQMSPGKQPGVAEGRDSREVRKGTCTRTVPFASLAPLSVGSSAGPRISEVSRPGSPERGKAPERMESELTSPTSSILKDLPARTHEVAGHGGNLAK